jgi:hypothetical protein
MKLSPGKKAKRTGRWAKTMTKWLVTFASRRGSVWQFVSFEGPGGGESRGIVDFVAIRRNHRSVHRELKAGDLFEVIFVQVKGGGARWPTTDDVRRLRGVAKYYHADHVVLADWQKGRAPQLYRLDGNAWVRVRPQDVF